MIGDIRLTLRQLVKHRGYASACVITLALAIGANTAIFSAVHAILLNPLPIVAPGDLVVGWGADSARGLSVVELSYRNVQDWPAVSQVFSRSAAMGSSNWTTVLDQGGDPARLVATLGSALVREDRNFHTIQCVEAAVRQHELLAGDEAALPLIAASRYLAAHATTTRSQRQTFDIARRLHRGEKLYEDVA